MYLFIYFAKLEKNNNIRNDNNCWETIINSTVEKQTKINFYSSKEMKMCYLFQSIIRTVFIKFYIIIRSVLLNFISNKNKKKIQTISNNEPHDYYTLLFF